MNNLRKLISHIIGIFLTYLIYIFPFQTIFEMLSGKHFLIYYPFLFSCLFYILLVIFFKSKKSLRIYRLIIHEGMGIGFISLFIILFALSIKSFFSFDYFYLGVSSLFLIFLLVFVSLKNGSLIRDKKIFLTTSKIKKNLKFLFMSDVHLGSNSKNYLNYVIIKIKKQNYDALLIGGDLIDSSSFDVNELKIFKTLNKPIFFISGNHELYLKEWIKISKEFHKFNIKIIDNKKQLFGGINIIGIGDNLLDKNREYMVQELQEKNKFNLILMHKPSLVWKKLTNIVDLMLCGHTHNGQIFPFNFIVKIKHKYTYGIFKNKNSTLYVSSGIGCWGPKMRLGSHNELVQIIIRKG